ncbi:unnamed protein product, partial [Callosobruchus maculatus]
LREDFRLEPQSTRVSAGEDVVIECQPPKGSPDPRVTWRKDGKPLSVEGRLRMVDGFSLAISQSRASDDGRYQCVASNPAGSRESAVAVLTIYVKPFMIRPPSDITALVDSTVEFSCAVGGDPVPDVLWRRAAPGGTMPLGRVRVLEDRTLRLERVTLMDQGTYTCDADNFAGAISASAHLTVLAPPTFSTRPSAQTVEVGQQVSFRCKSEGSPTPFLYWAIEGDRALLYPGAEQGGFEVTDTDGVSTLILKEAQIQNSGTVVICSAVNNAGSTSTRTRLTVTSKEDRPPPVIVTGPVNQTLPINSMASISCEAQGNPAPFISWYKGGVPVTSSSRLNMSIPNRITITGLQEEDTGPYTCVASSRFGKAVWTGYLLVANPKNPNINFFKAPEPPMLPGAPGRPHALNQSEGSVTITWGANNKIGSSSLLGYQVELFGREENVTPTWTVVGRRVPGTTFTQHLLTAGVPYTFLVRAENAHGIGPPSQLSEPIVVGPDSTQNWGNPEVTVLSEARANLMTPDVVKLVEGIALSSTAIKVSWMISDSTYVEGLYIYYVSLNADSSNPKGYSMLTVLHTGGSSSFTVNNLEKWSSYQFFLVPFFKTVEGFPSNSRTIKTLEDVPTEPPSHMEALLLNSTTVFLKWRPPAHSLNGELQGYRVEVRTNGTDVARGVNVNKIPNLMLNNLTAGVSYYVKVAAMTKAGVGPYNAEATLRLEPASRVIDNTRRPLDRHPSGDFITETWFMALLVSMVSVMVFLFVAMMLVRRRQLANGKKSLTPRTNGHIVKGDSAPSQPPPLWLDKSAVPEYSANGDRNTPLPDYARACAGIRRDSKALANGSIPEYHGSINLQANPLHPEFSRPESLHYSSEKYYPIMGKYKDYSCMQVQEYASPNLHPEKSDDYAEVNTSGNNGGDNGGKTSPAPYATTTLVAGAKKMLWTNFAQSCSASVHGVEDPPYPSLNGGYYNRKVYSDSYFSPTHTLRRPKRDRERTNHHPPELVSPSSANGSVYARVGPPGGATTSSWRSANGAAPSMSSFAPPPPPPAISIYQGPRLEPENML